VVPVEAGYFLIKRWSVGLSRRIWTMLLFRVILISRVVIFHSVLLVAKIAGLLKEIGHKIEMRSVLLT